MNAISHVVARRSNTWVYSPRVSAATSTGPNIRLGSVNLLSRISQYRAPSIPASQRPRQLALGGPGRPQQQRMLPGQNRHGQRPDHRRALVELIRQLSNDLPQAISGLCHSGLLNLKVVNHLNER